MGGGKVGNALMMTICPLCQQVHLYPLQDKICKVRLQIINLRLEERDLMRMLKQQQMLENSYLSTSNSTESPWFWYFQILIQLTDLRDIGYTVFIQTSKGLAMNIQNELFLNNASYRKLMRELASQERMLDRSKKQNNQLAIEIIESSMADTKAKMQKMEQEAK